MDDVRGVIIYNVQEDGRLEGLWSFVKEGSRQIVTGSETAIPRGFARGFGGTYDVRICDEQGNVGFIGTLQIEVQGKAFLINWTPGPESKEKDQPPFTGVGLIHRPDLVSAAYWAVL